MKKLLALALTFVLMLGLLPATARAEGYYWTFDDTNVGTLPAGFTTAVLDSAEYHSSISGHFPDGVAAAVRNWSSLSTGDCVFMSSWFTNSSIQANRWLITPALSISDTTDVLRWSAKSQDPDYLETYNVLISTTDNQPASFTTTLTSVASESGIWQQHYIDLSSYTDQTVYIAFQLVSLDKFILLLDNIGLIDSAASDALAVDAGSDQSVILGNSVTLTASVSGGDSPYTYSWSDGTTTVGSTASISVTPTTDTTYTCTITDKVGGSTSDSVAVTVLPALYTITVTPESMDFGSMAEGYTTAPMAQTVTVQNTGNQSVSLTTPANAHYDISAFSSSPLAAAGTATFTIQPKVGLAVGTYNETITVSTDHDTSADISVSFTVAAALTLSPSISGSTMYEGGRVTLTPSILGGTWTYDADYLTLSGNTFTALKAGQVTVGYDAADQHASYTLTIQASQLPNTGQNLTWIWVLAGTALTLAGAAAGLRLFRKQTR